MSGGAWVAVGDAHVTGGLGVVKHVLVNLLKVNNTMHQQCGRYNFTESLAQSDRVSSSPWVSYDGPGSQIPSP